MAGNKHWTETENEYLRAHYPAISAQRLREIIPDRTARAIRTHAQQLGIGKCHERLREMGAENIRKRWDRVMGQAEPPVQ